MNHLYIPSTTSLWVFRLYELASYPLLYLLLIAYLPYLWLHYHIRARPFPSWTWVRCRSTRIAKLHTHLLSLCLPPEETEHEAWSIPPSAIWRDARARGTTIEVVPIQPVAQELRRGIAVCAEVEPVVRPGFWITPAGVDTKRNEPWRQGENVILHIHGGGYIRGHPLWTGFGMGVAEKLGMRCFAINYRKCLSPSTAFPAPLLDALAGYLHLTQSLGIPAENILLLGESAGAHLALCLSRYLHDLSLPQPHRLVLVSPWCDFSVPPTQRTGSYHRWSGFDTCHCGRLGMGIRSATRYYPDTVVKGPYMSPALANKRDWAYLRGENVRVFVVYGTRELFEDEILALISGMRGADLDLEVHVDVDGIHTGVLNIPRANAAFLDALHDWYSIHT